MNEQNKTAYSCGEIFEYLSIPRLLITHPLYSGLSCEAKLIYSVLLEKQGECQTNGWIDEENRCYILFPDYKMQKFLNVSCEKLMDAYDELDYSTGIGLIERVPQVLDTPTRIYLKQFHHVLNVENVELKVKTPQTKEKYYAEVEAFNRRNTNNVISFPTLGV